MASPPSPSQNTPPLDTTSDLSPASPNSIIRRSTTRTLLLTPVRLLLPLLHPKLPIRSLSISNRSTTERSLQRYTPNRFIIPVWISYGHSLLSLTPGRLCGLIIIPLLHFINMDLDLTPLIERIYWLDFSCVYPVFLFLAVYT